MRTGFRSSIVVAALAMLALATPVAAASGWTTFKQAGTSAYAFTADACVENGDGTVTCDGTSIDVFEGSVRQTGEPTRNGEHACYSEHSVTYHPGTGEVIGSHSLFGCALDAGTLSTDNLTSVTLTPTVIDLTEVTCGPTECTESAAGSTTVYGTWTGVGAVTSQKGKFRFDDGTCMQVHADRGSSRQATFDGSIDAANARVGTGSFTFRTSCTY